ncbi:hypothetical protein [Streptomyces sp. MST-110588]|uniref:hypothetical protein n=1 Tax=Streptomyces sp. MST-110588 TaxID=2833628 RepID=UPI001F5DBF8F|nr:hypothetical protein [Streptomyces sp. MST-110588]UNO39033.1 hypothetical protein KGS77_04535 [Streptomyces sp. MST-110588]
MNDECALTRDEALTRDDSPVPETRGCLFALSQPPLMLFLTVIAVLLLAGALHDLYLL